MGQLDLIMKPLMAKMFKNAHYSVIADIVQQAAMRNQLDDVIYYAREMARMRLAEQAKSFYVEIYYPNAHTEYRKIDGWKQVQQAVKGKFAFIGAITSDAVEIAEKPDSEFLPIPPDLINISFVALGDVAPDGGRDLLTMFLFSEPKIN
jgi:hypothetical protein